MMVSLASSAPPLVQQETQEEKRIDGGAAAGMWLSLNGACNNNAETLGEER
jgi:hypothetical protein